MQQIWTCDTFPECEGRVMGRLSDGRGHATVLDEVSSSRLCAAHTTSPTLSWNHRSTNIPLSKTRPPPSTPTPEEKWGSSCFERCPVSDLSLFTAARAAHACVTITFTPQDTRTQEHTCTLMRMLSGNGDGVTKPWLILALNIWCAERSLVCVFHQDVPRRLSFLCLSSPCLRSGIVKRL